MTSWRQRAEAIRDGLQSAVSSLGRDTPGTTSGGSGTGGTPPAGSTPEESVRAESMPDTAASTVAGRLPGSAAPSGPEDAATSGMTVDGPSRQVDPAPAAPAEVRAPSEDVPPPAAPADQPSAAATPFRMPGYRSDGRRERFGPQIDSSLAGLARTSPDPVEAQDPAAHPPTTEIFVGARSITRRELRELRARAESAGEPLPEVRFGTAERVSGPSGARPPAAASGQVVPLADPAGVVEEIPAPLPVGAETPSDSAVGAEPTADDLPEPGPESHAALEYRPEPASHLEPTPQAQPELQTDVASQAGLEPQPEPEPTSQAELTAQPDARDESDPRSASEHPEAPAVTADAAGVIEVPGASDTPAVIEMPVIVEIDATPIAMIGVDDPAEHDVVVAELIETDTRADRPESAVSADEVTHAAAGDRAVAVPVGHWSLQATDEDENDLHDSTISRDVAATGGGPMTHALVLPSVPDQEEQLQTPIVATGEIVITGLVDVTRSDAAVSALPDNGLALPEEPEVVYAEPEPVRAPSRAPLVVAIVGLALVLIVAGAFFVAAVVYDIF